MPSQLSGYTESDDSKGSGLKEITVTLNGNKSYMDVATLFVDSNGNALKIIPQEENRSAADASGSDGATGRVLTLQNSVLSASPTSVWVDDQIIAQGDMTISHLAASSTITFDNINLFDASTVRVTYYV